MKSRSVAIRFLPAATAVLLLAAVMRLVALHDVPPGLAQDEVLNADVVGFIRQGYYRLFFPEGYGHEPLYHYWSVPFQVLLGDNVLSIRLPAVFLGLLLVALTMRWTRREFGGRTAVLTGAFLGVSWWPIIFSRIGLRPIMEPLFLVLFAWFWPRRPWPAGLFLGLTLYTYTGARVVFLIPALLLLYAFVRNRRAPDGRSLSEAVRPALIVLGVSLLVYLPLGLTLRADPSLQQRVAQLEGPLQALQAGDAQPILQATGRTLGFFSFTGDPRWTYMLPQRPLFDPVTALFFYGGLLLALVRLRRPRYAFVLVWLAVGLIPSAVTPDAPSSVRLVGAMPVVYLLPALALDWLWQCVRAINGRAWQTAVLLLLLGIPALTLARTLRDGFVRWPQALETRLKYQTVLLDMARYREAHADGALVVADSFYRPITADSLRRNLNANPQARWVQTGSEVAGAVVFPAEGDGRFYVPEFAPPDELLWDAGVPARPLYRSGRTPSFAVYPLPDAPAPAGNVTPVTFGEVIRLVGYETSPEADGRPLQLLTMWQVEGSLPEDLAVFVHLLDEEGQLAAQHDGFDAAPATLWPGDVVVQRHVLSPETVPDGRYTLQVGLYRRGDGQRLPHDDTAAARPDTVALAQVTIIDGKWVDG